MRRLALDLKCLRIKDRLSPDYYRREARHVMRRLSQSDKNFKHFFVEFINLSKENVEIETLREVISELQKYVCLRINQECPIASRPCAIRNKIKRSKKSYFEGLEDAY